MADDGILHEDHAPLNMRRAYTTLQAIYGEQNIPLVLGTEMHGGKTDMAQIEVGKDQMMLCLKNNYHNVPDIYTTSAPFFVLGHEFGHIVAHPGKDTKYWTTGSKELPVEGFQQFKWMNAISDILVNWTVMTATTVIDAAAKESMKKQMVDGWKASSLIRRCNTIEGYNAHRLRLKEKASGFTDNRYQPKGGLSGQYDNAEVGNKYKPTADTPFYQKHMGHGRGEQYYPPISYAVAEKLPEDWRKIKMLKDVGGLKKDRKYKVERTRTFDSRENTSEFEPISEFLIDGTWVSARYCEGVCPQCGNVCESLWGRWWGYVSPDEREAEIAQRGTWVYLLIQMYAYQWAMVYSSIFKMGSNPLIRATGEKFLDLIASDMDKVMRGN
jgi:hypothetical protein|tara:strand:+ start:11223 stop:12371 length:1149 start_codon:yes stop_codon:yes gene_type:complete